MECSRPPEIALRALPSLNERSTVQRAGRQSDAPGPAPGLPTALECLPVFFCSLFSVCFGVRNFGSDPCSVPVSCDAEIVNLMAQPLFLLCARRLSSHGIWGHQRWMTTGMPVTGTYYGLQNNVPLSTRPQDPKVRKDTVIWRPNIHLGMTTCP